MLLTPLVLTTFSLGGLPSDPKQYRLHPLNKFTKSSCPFACNVHTFLFIFVDCNKCKSNLRSHNGAFGVLLRCHETETEEVSAPFDRSSIWDRKEGAPKRYLFFVRFRRDCLLSYGISFWKGKCTPLNYA